MTKVYKVPAQFIEFLRSVEGVNGERLNMDVQDADGNTIVGQEEWDSDAFAHLHEQYPAESAMFELIDYNPKPIPRAFI